MKATKVVTLALALGLARIPPALAQASGDTQDKQEALKAGLKELHQATKGLPEDARKLLSSGAQNLLHLAEKASKNRFEGEIGERRELPGRDQLTLASSAARTWRGGLAPGDVSDPDSDFVFSRVSGFTQSETSTAWCGNQVVVGFNDSGSFLETLILPLPLGLSFNGVARSQNKGASFFDLGFLNPGLFPNLLAGDPVVACGDSNTFYYASLLDSFGPPITRISVSRSFNGGLSWGNPIATVSKSALEHLLDKDWMTVDPTNTSRLYVTYTDFDFSGACGTDPTTGDPLLRTAIELVRSTNNGSTWTPPQVIAEVCEATGFVQGSQVAVGPAGEVYIAWEFFGPGDSVDRRLSIKKSTNNGVAFGGTVKVDDVVFVGNGNLFQGGFRNNEFPSLAVDRSGTATNGHIYVTWNDGRNVQVADLDSPTGSYNFADVLIRKSTDGGATWGAAPVQVNNNDEPLPSGAGTDQYEPGVAVDKTGKVAVCFYDRRRDPPNSFIDYFCATSTNGGATWLNSRWTERRFAPFHNTDDLLVPEYMGDYDQPASDSTKANAGFVGAFAVNDRRGNPDVKSTRLH